MIPSNTLLNPSAETGSYWYLDWYRATCWPTSSSWITVLYMAGMGFG